MMNAQLVARITEENAWKDFVVVENDVYKEGLSKIQKLQSMHVLCIPFQLQHFCAYSSVINMSEIEKTRTYA